MSYISRLLRGTEDRAIEFDETAVARALEAEQLEKRQEPPRFKRPGESPAVPYIGNTRENLTKIVDKYHAEARALEADIARLIEEQRQLRVAIYSLEIAIGVINENDMSVDPVPHDGED